MERRSSMVRQTVTFVWQGESPLDLTDDFTDWEASPASLEPGGDELWFHTTKISPDAYIEFPPG
jgi:hypothetical protein